MFQNDLTFTIHCFYCSFISFFKEFERRDINTHHITVNYITASILAYFIYNKEVDIKEILSTSWIYQTIALGIFFVIMFNVMAKTTQKLGVSIAAMSSKMSLVIPVLVAYFFYPDSNVSSLQFLELS